MRLLTRLRVPAAVDGYDCHPNNVRRFCIRLARARVRVRGKGRGG